MLSKDSFLSDTKFLNKIQINNHSLNNFSKNILAGFFKMLLQFKKLFYFCNR
jgi:hypothetical protein